MKKILSTVLALTLSLSFMSSLAFAETPNVEVNEEVQTASKIVVVDGVEVELIGLVGSPILDSNSEVYSENIERISKYLSSANGIELRSDPGQGSSEIFAPRVRNTYAQSQWEGVKLGLIAAVTTSAGLIAAAISKTPATVTVVSTFAAAGATSVIDMAKPAYTETYIVKFWSFTYNRSIYQMITEIYDDKYYQQIKHVKASGYLDLVGGNQFRAVQ